MTLRARLILAFVALIISSASATIMIGNSVFGGKVDELARESVSVYALIAAQSLDARIDRMQLVARDIAARGADASDAATVDDVASGKAVLDFVWIADRTKSSLLFRAPREAGAESRPVWSAFDGDSAAAIVPASLHSMVGKVVRDQRPLAGTVVVSSPSMASMAGLREEEELLVLAAAAPTASQASGAILIGYILNGRDDWIEQAQLMVPDERRHHLMSTVLLGDRCIASSMGKEARDGVAGPGLVETVLRAGRHFVGTVSVAGEKYYAAYIPLRDVSGRIVGMLGMGNREDAVAQVRRRTTTLFTSLIAAGMIFGFAMIIVFSNWLVSPIAKLAEGVGRVARGDLDHKVRIESDDELGRLAHGFNRMVRAVKERDHKLREMTADRLTQAEKQISIGRLAAGVAHEINNPLTAILSLSSLWLRRMSADDPGREDVQIIVNETSRCREIVRSLLDFARERPIEKSIVDVNPIVRESVLLASKCVQVADVRIEQGISESPLMVNADRKLLQQVFLNVLLNAGEATGPAGVVRVETDEDSSGGFVQIRIIDNGRGIPKEQLNRIFEPFFTTKGIGRGTGLGLSVSLGIIQKHDGTIEIQSREGRGTTVTVLLPRVEEIPS